MDCVVVVDWVDVVVEPGTVTVVLDPTDSTLRTRVVEVVEAVPGVGSATLFPSDKSTVSPVFGIPDVSFM